MTTVDVLSDWATLKGFADTGSVLYYERTSFGVRVWTMVGYRRLVTELYDPDADVVGKPASSDADWADFDANYRPAIDAEPPPALQTVDIHGVGRLGRKLQIHESSRPDDETKSYTTVWQGAGDDTVNHIIGGGPLLQLDMTAGTTSAYVDAFFDPVYGDTWLHEGYAMWENAPWGSWLDVAAYLPATPVQTSSNLDYELDGNRLKIASGGPGTGTHGLAGTPIPVPNYYGTGYWNFDGSSLTPAAGNGAHDLWITERAVSQFLNRVPLFGTSYTYFMLQSADSARIVPPTFLRIGATSDGSAAWKISFFLTLYRERTVPPP